ncbi:hypothetical protein ACM26V_19480 [Salipaludibacillus sp. HK11]|uniref:hypothetical protein n=1 Tax=Salipaludibacillus sp. HK11 TaxID=3394320 RepID=UPI0039FDD7C8
MQYLIDHKRKFIHRTTYANDKCNFHITEVGNREFTQDMAYMKRLKLEKGYQQCEYCSILVEKPSEI